MEFFSHQTLSKLHQEIDAIASFVRPKGDNQGKVDMSEGTFINN